MAAIRTRKSGFWRLCRLTCGGGYAPLAPLYIYPREAAPRASSECLSQFSGRIQICKNSGTHDFPGVSVDERRMYIGSVRSLARTNRKAGGGQSFGRLYLKRTASSHSAEFKEPLNPASRLVTVTFSHGRNSVIGSLPFNAKLIHPIVRICFNLIRNASRCFRP